MTKQEKIIAGLVGVGAILAVVYLMYESKGQGAAVSSPGVLTPPPSDLPQYPNTQPIPATAFTIVNGMAPDSLYNVPVNGIQIPDLGVGELGDSGCDCDPCAEVTTLQSKMTVPPHVLENAVANLQSYKQKRIMFTQR